MSELVGELSAFWEEQQRMMSTRPRGRFREQTQRDKAQATLPKQQPAAAPAGEGEQPSLEALRAKAQRVEVWLEAEDISHPRWAEGAAAYVKLQEQIQEREDGAWHYLRRLGDRYRGVVIFPADYPGPMLGDTWQRLPDGRIEARLSLFELRIMRELRGIVESTDSESDA